MLKQKSCKSREIDGGEMTNRRGKENTKKPANVHLYLKKKSTPVREIFAPSALVAGTAGIETLLSTGLPKLLPTLS